MNNELVSTWVALHEIIEKEGDKAPKVDELFWANEQLDSLCYRSPDEAWKIILEILEISDNEFVLSNLAAGPLEDLLVYHGENLISQMQAEANNNIKFKNLLQQVWQNRMSDELWVKIQKIAFGTGTEH